MAPRRFLEILNRVFGYAIVDYESSQYFEQLFHQLVQQRKSEGSAAAADLLQSMADKIVVAKQTSSHTRLEPGTHITWSKKGRPGLTILNIHSQLTTERHGVQYVHEVQ